MASEKILVLTAIVLMCQACSVMCQARVEYLNQPYCPQTISGPPAVCVPPVVSQAPFVQTAPQLVVPALIKSVAQPCDPYLPEPAPIVPNYGGYSGFYPGMPCPLPPIIIQDDDDDKWHHLLYFLIFAMRNRRNNCGNFGGNNCGGGCGGNYGGYNGCYDSYGCGGCGGYCGGNCGYNGGCGCGYNYPYPPYPYPYPGPLYASAPEAVYPVEEPIVPGYQTATPNEINLIIRTDCPCCC